MKKNLFIFSLCALSFFSQNSHALPSFSRQTGQSCSTCHLNYRELTPEGRQFKLQSYSAGDYVLPLSVKGVVSDTKIRSTASSVNPDVTMPKNGTPILEATSLFLAGKFYDNLGGYLQLNFNAANTKPIYGSQGVQTGTKVGGDTYFEASEIRYSRNAIVGGHDAVWGVSLNNAPGVSDLWVSSPVKSYPYRTSGLVNAWGVGHLGPTTLIDGGLTSQVGGYGLYAMIDGNIYAELSNYQDSKLGSSIFSVDQPISTVRNSFNPYWRLAYNRVQGSDSFMLGTFGMITTLLRDKTIPGSSSGRYMDIGLDGGYQHITDKHSWTSQFTFINEDVNWNARSLGRNHDAAQSNLQTLKAKITYDYARTYGASAFAFYSRGSTDNLYWAYNPDPTVITGACNQNNSLLAYCSANGRPDTSGYGLELYYVPLPNVHIALQQTIYRKFLGGATFIDNSSGNFRSASDNNLTYLYALISY